MKQIQCQIFTLLLLTIISFAGCSYKFGETRSEWAKGNKKLAIETFKNMSHDFAAENTFSKAATEVFVKRGGYTLVSREKCEIYLNGIILDIRENAISKRIENYGHRISSYNLFAKIEVKLFDKSGLLMWSTMIEDSVVFSGSINAIELAQNRKNAIQMLAENMMKKSYTELSEDF